MDQDDAIPFSKVLSSFQSLESHLFEQLSRIKVQITNDRKELDQRIRQLEDDRRKLEEEKRVMKEYVGKVDEIVEINVGGQRFTTTRTTLTSIKGSMLESMFSGRWTIQTDKTGAYFIDRDPKFFGLILNFLRDPSIDIQMDEYQMKLFRKEVEFYGLTDAIFPSTQLTTVEEAKGNWMLELDPETCGPDLSFSNNNLCVSKTKNDSVWSMAISKKPVPLQGKSYWEISTSNNYVTFGVTTSFVKDGRRAWGVDSNCYGYNPRCQYRVNGKASAIYGTAQDSVPFKIGVLIDMSEGNLTFYKNNECLGVAFTGLKGMTLYPFVSVPSATSKIEFIQDGKLPQ